MQGLTSAEAVSDLAEALTSEDTGPTSVQVVASRPRSDGCVSYPQRASLNGWPLVWARGKLD